MLNKSRPVPYMNKILTRSITIVAVLLSGLVFADGWLGQNENPDPAAPGSGFSSKAGNVESIVESRHNLTMSYLSSGLLANMSNRRNDYYEVCVYCHTPHGANSRAAAPLWNRTVLASSYTTYNNASSLTGSTITQPGPNSLTCLSCHDGVTAIDSIINMPTVLNGGSYSDTNIAGRAGYMVRGTDGESPQESFDNNTFLNAWNNYSLKDSTQADTFANRQYDNQLIQDGKITSIPDDLATGTHYNIGPGSECQVCHAYSGIRDANGVKSTGGNTGKAPEFGIFAIGWDFNRTAEVKYSEANPNSSGDPKFGDPDAGIAPVTVSGGIPSLSQKGFLGDDHPIGVRYPTQFGTDSGYREPDVMKARIAFFDRDGDGHADPEDIRMYDTGDGYEVECGSCHDPHGVKLNDTSNSLIPSFLRVGLSRTTDTNMSIYDDVDQRIISNMSGNNLEPGVISNIEVSGNAGSRLCLTCHIK